MDGKEKLAELLNTAASHVTMLGPSDLSGLAPLQDAVGQIQAIAAGMDGAQAEMRAIIGGSADEVMRLLCDMAKADRGSATESIGSVTKAITDIQKMVDEALAGEKKAQAPAPAREEKPAATSVISEEDMPLVMDFIAEANEHVETGEKALLAIEKNPSDKEAVNQVFRSFHTIKGMAGFLNLVTIGSLAHAAENVLDMARKEKLTITGHVADAVLESVDMMKKMLTELKEAAESGRAPASQDGLDTMLARLKGIGEGKATPTASAAAQPVVASSTAPTKQDAAPTEPQAASETTPAASAVAQPAVAAATVAAPVATAPQSTTAAKGATTDEKIKVSTERLDLLVNMVGELVTAQLMISEGVGSGSNSMVELTRRVAHQGKIVRELQELSMSMRMVPIAGVFQKMARLVRDLSQKSGKAVEFITTGEETELDRSIVDNVSDPLVHMIRNSMDHGLESPEDRVAAGKSPSGKIELRAFHQAGNIVIEIEDDGRGLNKDRILKKAIDNGLVSPGQDLSDDEIYKLIFAAGLSTAEKVTAISGRGVGMDVVKKNVDALRGRIDIRSTLGKGTTFSVRLPLTLAVIDGQVVRVGQERYIVPLNSIVQSMRPEGKQITTVAERGEMALIRGQLLPFVRLHSLFDVPNAEHDPAKALMMIVEENGRKCGLMVDDLLGQQQVVIKTLGDGLGKITGVSGGAIMGDGRVCLILDAAGIITAWQTKE